jgi:mannose/cellobiose epimerase-like protein (N-acyl-D-glucosamine 2-epimerase family)
MKTPQFILDHLKPNITEIVLNTGKNFVSNSVSDEDKDLFFGPLDIGGEVFVETESNWCMAHILHNVGMFKSITQARKNGWDKPIPEGFTIITVGKKAKRQDIFILNIA